ncbi:MAG: hypothetical protein HY890_05745 [Deltaproteobacteria bacterium]|nr:hypothetical protein [Deltaproteobacteria bacterium]
MTEKCRLCGCLLHRTKDTYAKPTVLGRSHATKHHYVAKRFFGRSTNRQGTQREAIFQKEHHWGQKNGTEVFCYECHEELLHNPVLLPDDFDSLAKIIRIRKLNETEKTESREKNAGRIEVLHEVLKEGIKAVLKK